MRTLFASATILFLAWAASARADGLIYQLPEDGTWATFELSGTGKTDDKDEKLTGTVRVALVGSATVKKEPCRWIEVAFEGKSEQETEKTKVVVKALVPEKFLKKGETPVDHVVRSWIRTEDAKPKKLKEFKDIHASPLPMVLAGPLKDAKQLDETVLESKLGKLPCAGVAGQLEFKSAEGEAESVKVETRLNAKAPFGVVAARWILDSKDEKATFDLKLVDFGDKAKSELPDQQ